MKNELIINN
ncbi:hypothetical protein YPPY54_3426, partial [Yersinia pestis PY-54]